MFTSPIIILGLYSFYSSLESDGKLGCNLPIISGLIYFHENLGSSPSFLKLINLSRWLKILLAPKDNFLLLRIKTTPYDKNPKREEVNF